jgi:aminodeoxyfutalosine deaminase
MKSLILHRASAILDADRLQSPGAILMEGDRIIAVGSPAEVGTPAEARIVHHQAVLTPALVNVHTHLDLSHVGPLPYTGSFTSWVDVVRSHRSADESRLRSAVLKGVDMLRAGGVAAVGDIAGVRSLAAAEALASTDIAGISFIELFGLGQRRSLTIDFLRELAPTLESPRRDFRFGLQPHAPYSCHPDVYAAAAATGLPIATHLAETVDEIRFTRSGDGPLAEMLRRLGVWDESIAPARLHPVDLLAPILSQTPCIAAHLNYVDDIRLDEIARWPLTVAYCPRASAYFGHPVDADENPSHRYRDMAHAGINVAIGTDSILCLDTPDRLSPLDELRLLFRRDGGDPRDLIRMATVNGARALGLDADRFRLRPGAIAGVLAIPSLDGGDAVRSALSTADPPEWLAGGGSAE